MDRNKKEALKLNIKLWFRKFIPHGILPLIRRRQIPPDKMLKFLHEFEQKKNTAPTAVNSLAIIIPCYNHSQFLSLAFESAVNQTHKPNQIILIDDCSSDDTYKVIETLISNHKKNNTDNKIEFLIEKNEKNLGQAITINKAISLTLADLIMILNDDDYLMSDIVELSLSTFKNRPSLALIGGTNISFRNDIILTNTSKLGRDQIGANKELTIKKPEEALSYENFCDLNMTHTGSTFSRIKALSVGLYRPLKERIIRFSDRDFQIRLNLLYPVAVYYNFPFCFWREDSSQDSGVNS